jgi:2-amino-4-hydroxy-6-hydroxymethyldihydropteridine diphosphokinase
MYVTDQPAFLNGAVELETDWEPHELLRRIKVVEAKMGRDLEGGIRNGPRPVDLDILLYETRHDDDGLDDRGTWKPLRLDTPDLVIPHIRIQEREFVLAPLCEAAGRDMMHPVLNETIGDLCNRLQLTAVRVLPLARGRMLCFNETIVMGILNVTPDSFSDGGQWSSSVERAALRALEMVQEGAGIIDIGGESTRPGAKEVAVEEEIQRTIAVIKRIRQGTSCIFYSFLVMVYG